MVNSELLIFDMRLLCLVLLFISAKCFAQYPFEKLPVRKVDSVAYHIVKSKGKSSNIAVAHYKTYRVELLQDSLQDGSDVLLFHNNKLIKRVKNAFRLITAPYPLYIYTYEGDTDFLISFSNDGNGLASSLVHKVYLFDTGKKNYKATSFMDFNNKPSRQYKFGEQGRYEIVCQSLAKYKGHNYWLFDLYNFEKGKLVNVSSKYGYPIAVPYLFNETFKATNKISKKELQRLSLKLPEFYTVN